MDFLIGMVVGALFGVLAMCVFVGGGRDDR